MPNRKLVRGRSSLARLVQHYIICHFGTMKKRTKVIFLLCLLDLPGKVLFSEQIKAYVVLYGSLQQHQNHEGWCMDTSTSQMMLSPFCLARFLLWSLFSCVFLFCFADLMIFSICGCSQVFAGLILCHVCNSILTCHYSKLISLLYTRFG